MTIDGITQRYFFFYSINGSLNNSFCWLNSYKKKKITELKCIKPVEDDMAAPRVWLVTSWW